MSRRRKLLWAAVVMAGVLAIISAADERGFRHYLRLERDVGVLLQRNRDLAERNRAMVGEIEALRNERGALERAAREELGFVKPGELIINLE